jgi:hypothetical protein
MGASAPFNFLRRIIMAGEDYGTGDKKQTPEDWLCNDAGSSNKYTHTGNTVTLDLSPSISNYATTTTGSSGTLDADTGDVRAAYLAVIEYLHDRYKQKDDTANFNMPDDMHMSKAEVKDPNTDTITTVYTFRIKQTGTISGGYTTPTGSVSGLPSETNAG